MIASSSCCCCSQNFDFKLFFEPFDFLPFSFIVRTHDYTSLYLSAYDSWGSPLKKTRFFSNSYLSSFDYDGVVPIVPSNFFSSSNFILNSDSLFGNNFQYNTFDVIDSYYRSIPYSDDIVGKIFSSPVLLRGSASPFSLAINLSVRSKEIINSSYPEYSLSGFIESLGSSKYLIGSAPIPLLIIIATRLNVCIDFVVSYNSSDGGYSYAKI